jgi:hypothetical protein
MIHMRNAIGLVLAALTPGILFAAPPDKFCFVGEVKLSFPDGKAMGSQAMLVEKIHDPDNALIIEHAIVGTVWRLGDTRRDLLAYRGPGEDPPCGQWH